MHINKDADSTLGNSLFGAVKLTKNADSNKYSYSGYGSKFFLLSDSNSFCNNVIILGAVMNSLCILIFIKICLFLVKFQQMI